MIFFRKTILPLLVVSLLFSPLVIYAQGTITPVDPPSDGSDPWGFGAKLDNVAGPYSPQTAVPLEDRIGDIIGIFLSFLGVIFLILMLHAGYNWMTAAGDEEKITKAKDTIRAAIIGLIIIVAAYALSIFVIESIWGSASG